MLALPMGKVESEVGFHATSCCSSRPVIRHMSTVFQARTERNGIHGVTSALIKTYHIKLLCKSMIMIHLGRLSQLFYETLMQYDFCANRTKKHSRETMSMASKKPPGKEELTTGRLSKSRKEGAGGHFSLEMTAHKVLGL